MKKKLAGKPSKFKRAENGGEYDENKYDEDYRAPKSSTSSSSSSSSTKTVTSKSANDDEASAGSKSKAVSAPEKKQSFGEAFKAARAAKKGTFEWNGKKYTSDTKEEAAKKSAPASKPAASAPAKSEPAKSTSRPNPNGPESEAPPKRTNMLPEVTVVGKRPVKKAEETNPRTKTDAMQKVVDAGAKNTSKLTRLGKVLKKGGTVKKKMKTGGSFPDLNKDGKITKADVLVGRGVVKAKKGIKMKAGGKMKKGKC